MFIGKQLNTKDCVWKELRQEFMKTTLQGKVTLHCIIKNLLNKFIPLSPAIKRKFRRGFWRKVRHKLEVIEEARNKCVKVHFASLMDNCHVKNSELEKKNQKYNGRVVLLGDIVKDDSRSFAVFTEQGSSATQITAAKTKDII